MQVYCKGTARLKHKTTGSIHEIESDELDWDVVGGDERQMGPEIHYEAVVEHRELGRLTWSLWEYPQGIENFRETNKGEHELLEDFDYGLDGPDIWVDYTLPDDPLTIFMDSYHRTGDLLADHGGDDGRNLLNRMVFSHQVTALEAYLGDTLIKEVLADKAARTRLMTEDRELAKERFSLAQIAAATDDLVETRIIEYLRSIQYHNLEKVDFLYRTIFQIPILKLAQDTTGLLKAVRLRHDCVHRNGFDKDGNELTVFTKQFVQDTADLIKEFVAEIEKQIRARPR